MKMKNKIIIPPIVGVLVLGITLAGCSNATSSTSKEELMEMALKKVETSNSLETDFTMNIDGQIKASGLTLSAKMDTDITLETNIKTNEKHIKGSYKLSALGQEEEANLELYEVNENNKTYQYTNFKDGTTDTGWTVGEKLSENENINHDFNINPKDIADIYNKLKTYLNNFTLQNKTEKKDGRDCYLVTGVIKGSDMLKFASDDIKNSSFDSEIADLKKSGINLEKLNVDIKLYFEKSSKDPYIFEFDMSKGISDAISGIDMSEIKGAKVEFPTFKGSLKFDNFDKIDSIKVPSDIKSKAKKTESKDLNTEEIINSFNPLKSF